MGPSWPHARPWLPKAPARPPRCAVPFPATLGDLPLLCFTSPTHPPHTQDYEFLSSNVAVRASGR